MRSLIYNFLWLSNEFGIWIQLAWCPASRSDQLFDLSCEFMRSCGKSECWPSHSRELLSIRPLSFLGITLPLISATLVENFICRLESFQIRSQLFQITTERTGFFTSGFRREFMNRHLLHCKFLAESLHNIHANRRPRRRRKFSASRCEFPKRCEFVLNNPTSTGRFWRIWTEFWQQPRMIRVTTIVSASRHSLAGMLGIPASRLRSRHIPASHFPASHLGKDCVISRQSHFSRHSFGNPLHSRQSHSRQSSEASRNYGDNYSANEVSYW